MSTGAHCAPERFPFLTRVGGWQTGRQENEFWGAKPTSCAGEGDLLSHHTVYSLCEEDGDCPRAQECACTVLSNRVCCRLVETWSDPS